MLVSDCSRFEKIKNGNCILYSVSRIPEYAKEKLPSAICTNRHPKNR